MYTLVPSPMSMSLCSFKQDLMSVTFIHGLFDKDRAKYLQNKSIPRNTLICKGPNDRQTNG